MTALAAGFGAALAGGPDDAHAQVTEIRIPLEHSIVLPSGEMSEIIMNVQGVAYETQTAIMDHLAACIGAAEKARDVCVGEAATLMAQQRLDAIVFETNARLQPLSEAIGLTVADLIREPVFCDYASDSSSAESCTNAIGNVQVAAGEYRLASATERLITTETREAGLDGVRPSGGPV